MPATAPHATPKRVRNPPDDAAGGPDLAWIAACVALLLAGGLLGVTGDRRIGTSKRIRALLRPLVARR
jgi:hypothetical protein